MLRFIRQIIDRLGRKPTLTERPEEDDVVGGWWGNKIEWMTCDFERSVFKVVGWKPLDQRPRVGSVIKADMKRSAIWFRVTSIRFPGDPHDMFFADLTPVWQEMKEDHTNG